MPKNRPGNAPRKRPQETPPENAPRKRPQETPTGNAPRKSPPKGKTPQKTLEKCLQETPPGFRTHCTFAWTEEFLDATICDAKCLDDVFPEKFCGSIVNPNLANMYLVEKLDGACYKEFPGGKYHVDNTPQTDPDSPTAMLKPTQAFLELDSIKNQANHVEACKKFCAGKNSKFSSLKIYDTVAFETACICLRNDGLEDLDDVFNGGTIVDSRFCDRGCKDSTIGNFCGSSEGSWHSGYHNVYVTDYAEPALKNLHQILNIGKIDEIHGPMISVDASGRIVFNLEQATVDGFLSGSDLKLVNEIPEIVLNKNYRGFF